MNCDSCGVRVSTKGFLGGGIICHTCAELKRKDETQKLERRRERYGENNE